MSSSCAKAPPFDVHTRSFGRRSLYNILRGNSLQLFSKKRGGGRQTLWNMRGYLCSFWARHGAAQKMKEQAGASGSPAVGGWIFQPAGRPARQAVRRSVAGGFARASRVITKDSNKTGVRMRKSKIIGNRCKNRHRRFCESRKTNMSMRPSNRSEQPRLRKTIASGVRTGRRRTTVTLNLVCFSSTTRSEKP